jgi:pimeloyl-ACP methyl ester carboxylesterase
MTMERRLPDEADLEELMIDGAGLRLKLRIWGKRTKPALILLHGGRDQGRSWDWTVAELLPDYCVLVPDLRGHGDSDHATTGGYEMVDFLADHALVVQRLVAMGFASPFPMVGHSFGGNILLHYAASFPEHVSKLAVLEGVGFSQERFESIVSQPSPERWRKAVERRMSVSTRPPRQFPSLTLAADRIAGLHPQLPRDVVEHLALHAVRQTEDGYVWKYDSLFGGQSLRPVPPDEYAKLYNAIRSPVCLFYGQDSWATSPAADGRMEMFQQATLHELDDAGHWLHHDRLDRFIPFLKQFLRG